MILIYGSLFIIGILCLFFTVYLWFLACASFIPERRRALQHNGAKKIAIVVPAHNEVKVIARTVASLKALDYPADRFEIVVVADNCEDDTAQIAKENGAIVLQRRDPEKRGKGYALDWAFGRLKEQGFDAFVIIDADTIVDRNLLRAMNQRLSEGAKAIQGYYDVMNPGKSPMASLSYLGFVVSRNLRYKGRSRLGWSCNLLGNGMCFAGEIINKYGWPAKSIVEDIEFEMMLLVDGTSVAFAPEARIYAEIPDKFEDSSTQRTRWDLGKFQVRNKFLPQLLRQGIQRRSLACLDGALELLIPPFSLYWVSLLAFFFLALLVSRANMSSLALLWSIIIAATAIYTALGLIIAKAPWNIYRNLLFVPFFLLWRVKIVLQGYFSGAAKQWVKTERQ